MNLIWLDHKRALKILDTEAGFQNGIFINKTTPENSME